MDKLKKQLLIDSELRRLYETYDVAPNVTPYGFMSRLLDKKATINDIEELYYNSYCMASLFNNNTWL